MISKQPDHGRFGPLDAMRGVAAVIVVLHHLANLQLGPVAPRFGHLAVDLFFALSGFVIAFSYDPRFADGLTVRAFMERQVVRLFPLYLIGLALGFATAPLVLDRWATLAQDHGSSQAARLALTALANTVMLPGATHILFPFNHPMWSLLFELWVANLLYALLWPRLTARVLAAALFLAAIALVPAVMHRHSFDEGWDWGGLKFGAVRVLFSFAEGVLLARLRALRPPRRSAPALAIVALSGAALFVPVQGIAAGWYELSCVFVTFPALIWWGAQAKERRPWIGRMLGDTSYALYAIHWPVLVAMSSTSLPKIVAGLSWPAGATLQIATISLLVAVGWAVHTYVDVPVRRWLTARLRRRGPNRTATA